MFCHWDFCFQLETSVSQELQLREASLWWKIFMVAPNILWSYESSWCLLGTQRVWSYLEAAFRRTWQICLASTPGNERITTLYFDWVVWPGLAAPLTSARVVRLAGLGCFLFSDRLPVSAFDVLDLAAWTLTVPCLAQAIWWYFLLGFEPILMVMGVYPPVVSIIYFINWNLFRRKWGGARHDYYCSNQAQVLVWKVYTGTACRLFTIFGPWISVTGFFCFFSWQKLGMTSNQVLAH